MWDSSLGLVRSHNPRGQCCQTALVDAVGSDRRWIAAAGGSPPAGCGGRLSSGWQAPTSPGLFKEAHRGEVYAPARRCQAIIVESSPEDKNPWSRKGGGRAAGGGSGGPFRAQVLAGRRRLKATRRA